MGRITINDISENREVSLGELRAIIGGSAVQEGMFTMGQTNFSPEIMSLVSAMRASTGRPAIFQQHGVSEFTY